MLTIIQKIEEILVVPKYKIVNKSNSKTKIATPLLVNKILIQIDRDLPILWEEYLQTQIQHNNKTINL